MSVFDKTSIRVALAFAALMPASLAAQVTMASSASGQRQHLFDARDFGIDPASVTFTKDIAPILQRSCENCHRPDGAGPMALVTYQDVRRYAGRIRDRTAIRDRMGAMPPWYAEKDIGIQQYKNDPSLSDEASNRRPPPDVRAPDRARQFLRGERVHPCRLQLVDPFGGPLCHARLLAYVHEECSF